MGAHILHYGDDLSRPLFSLDVSLNGWEIPQLPTQGMMGLVGCPSGSKNVAISLAGFPGEDVDEPQAWPAETAQPLASEGAEPSSR